MRARARIYMSIPLPAVAEASTMRVLFMEEKRTFPWQACVRRATRRENKMIPRAAIDDLIASPQSKLSDDSKVVVTWRGRQSETHPLMLTMEVSPTPWGPNPLYIYRYTYIHMQYIASRNYFILSREKTGVINGLLNLALYAQKNKSTIGFGGQLFD